MPRSKINLLIGQEYNNGYRPVCAKIYEDNVCTNGNNKPPKYWKIKPIEFETLTQLLTKIKPYIEGTHEDSNYTSLFYADINEDALDKNGVFSRAGQCIPMPRDYIILDIETQSGIYGDISTDLNEIYKWMLKTYDWLDEENGILLHHSGSAGIKVNNKHENIRVRAIVKTNMPITQKERTWFISPDTRQKGCSVLENHIDQVSKNDTQLFYLSPPIIKNTDHIHIEPNKRWFLKEGTDISSTLFTSNSDDISEPRKGLDSSSFLGVPSANQLVNSKTIDEWLADIGTPKSMERGKELGTYNRIWYALWKSEIEGRTEDTLQQLLNHWYLKDHQDGKGEEDYLLGVLEHVRENVKYDFSIPFTPNYNYHKEIPVDELLLKNWGGEIEYHLKDKQTILLKLYEGAGKTKSLLPLFENDEYKDLRKLYISPNITPTEAFCKDVGINCYNDEEDKTKLHTYKELGCCYNSLKHLQIEQDEDYYIPTYDVVICDEIEQLLVWSINDMVNEKAWVNDIFINLLRNAKCVIGADSRISNLSMMFMHKIRKEPFDIYTHDTVKPFQDHRFTIFNTMSEGVNQVVRAIKEGKKVAIVSELDGDVSKEQNIEHLKDFVEKETGKKGIAIWSETKKEDYKKQLLTDLSEILISSAGEETKHYGELEDALTSDTIQHLWLSPIIQSSWNYLALEEQGVFDMVFGFYPLHPGNLNAPSIIQQLRRFRQTKDYGIFIHSSGLKWDNSSGLYNQLNTHLGERPEKISLAELRQNYTKFQGTEFNKRTRLIKKNENLMINHRGDHLIEMIKERGGIVIDTEQESDKSGWRTELHNSHKKLKELMMTQKIWDKTQNYYETYEPQQDGTNKHINPESTFLNLRKKQDKTLEDWATIFLYEIRYSKNWGYKIDADNKLEDAIEHFLISDRVKTLEHRMLLDLSKEEREEKETWKIEANRKYLTKKGRLIDSCCELLGIEKDTDFKIVDRVITKDEIKESQWFEDVQKYWGLIQTLYGLNVPVKTSFIDNPITFFRTFAKQVLGVLIDKTKAQGGASKLWESLIKEHKKRDIYKRKAPHGLGLDRKPPQVRETKKMSRKWVLSIPYEDRTPLEQRWTVDALEGVIVNSKRQPEWSGYFPENSQIQGIGISQDVERRVF